MGAFTLEVSLLHGVYEATHPISGGAEWPPHPFRLFAALVAAAGSTRTQAQAEALRWLETQPPPVVTASIAQTQQPGVTRYVPLDRPESSVRYPFDVPRGELRGPFTVPEAPQVGFTWSALPPPPVQTALRELAGEVAYLGRSSSPVSVRTTTAPPATDRMGAWQPEAGSERLRVPGPGLLDALDARYADADRAVWPSAVGYGLAIQQQPTPPVAAGPFAEELVVFRRVDGPRVPIERTLTVTSLFRQALLQRLDQDCPPVFTGHGNQTGPAGHAAYLPTPQVGDQHADGHLLGVMLALPRNVAAAERRLLRHAPTRLTLGSRLGVWTLEPLRALDLAQAEQADRAATASGRSPWALRPARWTRLSAVWISATPVALPFAGSGRKFRQEAARGVRRACVKAGYPEPLQVEVAPVAWVRGGGHARRYHTLRRPGDRPRAVVHTRVQFPGLVRGPVLLGPLRFFGLGLLVPEPNPHEQVRP